MWPDQPGNLIPVTSPNTCDRLRIRTSGEAKVRPWLLERRRPYALMVVCDGVGAYHRPSCKHASFTCCAHAARQHWNANAKALKPVYTGAPEAAALERFMEFAEIWGGGDPAIVKLWEDAWAEFVPSLNFDTEIRLVICLTNAIESVNARIRRTVKASGHFPNEQAALKCVYMAITSLAPTGRGRNRWITRWKAALSAFAITFEAT
ncbi:transposase [Nonomuraea sp. NPDC048881]|uniref:transposase n=1 Tax=Nonomuraea sp. NPDC048881 TaxID=3155030 RepID=UPI0033E3F177